ncbi:MAG: sulfite reductase flavoprotein subunit alpha [Pseudomonadota bacterium]
MLTPKIPDDAPFSEEQKIWLAGYLAGLGSQLLQPQGQANVAAIAAATSDSPLREIHVFFGTQTGNSEEAAIETAEAAKSLGFIPQVRDLSDVSAEDLIEISRAIFVCSTYGEGEMPDGAHTFWESLQARAAPRLENMKYSVLALGDTAYDEFCQAGKLLDTRLEQLGAQRVAPRKDCDIDFEEPAADWRNVTLESFKRIDGDDGETGPEVGTPSAQPQPQAKRSKWNRNNPYTSQLLARHLLSGDGSEKEIIHYEFDTGDGEIEYTAGDAIGVHPFNDPSLVDEVLARMNYEPEVDGGNGRTISERLSVELDLRTPSPALLQFIEERVDDEELSHVLGHGDKEALERWLWGRDVLDILNLDPKLSIECEKFVELLRRQQHRAYSISSSPLVHKTSVHLTVATVRWDGNGRKYSGCCSGYLADRLDVGQTAQLFAVPNKLFRPPADTDTPMIMVGPGTGIAPFRAFLQERQAIGAKGRNWLFFGDQHCASDFIYEEEFSAMADDGLLSRMDLAFSRDQKEKVYVQHRMAENGRDLFAWLEDGAAFYVCGDATRMAKDVEMTLKEIIAEHGAMSKQDAEAYLARLRKEKRYLRDVY